MPEIKGRGFLAELCLFYFTAKNLQEGQTVAENQQGQSLLPVPSSYNYALGWWWQLLQRNWLSQMQNVYSSSRKNKR